MLEPNLKTTLLIELGNTMCGGISIVNELLSQKDADADIELFVSELNILSRLYAATSAERFNELSVYEKKRLIDFCELVRNEK